MCKILTDFLKVIGIMKETGIFSELKYFSRYEFGKWADKMNPVLLKKIDMLRDSWGAPIMISPADGALGRIINPGEIGYDSQHNYIKYGQVNAGDFMFVKKINGEPVPLNVHERKRVYSLAREIGFHGIGIYPDSKPYTMFHFDMRPDANEYNPALWSAYRSSVNEPWKYDNIERALV